MPKAAIPRPTAGTLKRPAEIPSRMRPVAMRRVVIRAPVLEQGPELVRVQAAAARAARKRKAPMVSVARMAIP
ncbi:MAG: hypothetical protein Fues2KO_03890 [Fuerstiella sp.]